MLLTKIWENLSILKTIIIEMTWKKLFWIFKNSSLKTLQMEMWKRQKIFWISTTLECEGMIRTSFSFLVEVLWPCWCLVLYLCCYLPPMRKKIKSMMQSVTPFQSYEWRWSLHLLSLELPWISTYSRSWVSTTFTSLNLTHMLKLHIGPYTE